MHVGRVKQLYLGSQLKEDKLKVEPSAVNCYSLWPPLGSELVAQMMGPDMGPDDGSVGAELTHGSCSHGALSTRALHEVSRDLFKP